jgi:hypothetical protein
MEATPFLSEIATALIVALVPVIIGMLGFVARWVVAYVKARVAAEHYAILSQLARRAVEAIEQTLKGEPSKAKLAVAKAAVESALLARGIRLDEEEIVSAIEAAVYAEKLSFGHFVVEQEGPSVASAIPSAEVAEGATDQ